MAIFPSKSRQTRNSPLTLRHPCRCHCTSAPSRHCWQLRIPN